MRHTFSAHTDMNWSELVERVHPYFRGLRGNICLGYRISGDGRRITTSLTCDFDWNQAMCRMREKIRVARTRRVNMEIENTVSTTSSRNDENILT